VLLLAVFEALPAGTRHDCQAGIAPDGIMANHTAPAPSLVHLWVRCHPILCSRISTAAAYRRVVGVVGVAACHGSIECALSARRTSLIIGVQVVSRLGPFPGAADDGRLLLLPGRGGGEPMAWSYKTQRGIGFARVLASTVGIRASPPPGRRLANNTAATARPRRPMRSQLLHSPPSLPFLTASSSPGQPS